MMAADQNPNPEAASSETVVADIKPLGPIASGRILQSKLWWITLICLGVAIYSAYHSQRPAGFLITIDFPEGHGLKEGDVIEHRGIDVGLVNSVELTEDLLGVRASVLVNDSAKGIAVEGSEFWIVRPHFSLTDISGLETAVGSKYIAVNPGPADGPRKRKFEGLKEPPTLGIDEGGFEIVLKAKESYGINPRAPLLFRGIPIGRITSVELDSKAMYVEMRAIVEPRYQSLLRKGTKFWQSSGINIDARFTRVKVNTDSLAALAIGGVSLITPKTRNTEDLDLIEQGHVYDLLDESDQKWLENAIPIELGTKE